MNIHNIFQENIPDNFNPICPTMLEIKIYLNGVLKLVSNLKPDKAAGHYSIKQLILKQLKTEINCSYYIPLIQPPPPLQTGHFPIDWKSRSLSLIKKGDKTEPSNYMPISLACILCKVMGHTIASNKYNILYKLQHGLREQSSCETKLIQFVDLGRQLSLGKQTDLGKQPWVGLQYLIVVFPDHTHFLSRFLVLFWI